MLRRAWVQSQSLSATLPAHRAPDKHTHKNSQVDRDGHLSRPQLPRCAAAGPIKAPAHRRTVLGALITAARLSRGMLFHSKRVRRQVPLGFVGHWSVSATKTSVRDVLPQLLFSVLFGGVMILSVLNVVILSIPTILKGLKNALLFMFFPVIVFPDLL